MRLGRVGRVDDDLGDPVAVAEVEEDQLAVVAAAVDPAREACRRAGVGRAQGAAGVRPVGRGEVVGASVMAGVSYRAPPIDRRAATGIPPGDAGASATSRLLVHIATGRSTHPGGPGAARRANGRSPAATRVDVFIAGDGVGRPAGHTRCRWQASDRAVLASTSMPSSPAGPASRLGTVEQGRGVGPAGRRGRRRSSSRRRMSWPATFDADRVLTY